MAKSIKEKVIEQASKYIWGRLKVIFLMIFLLIIVKNHPGWDAFFAVILMLQVFLSIWMVLSLPNKILKEQQKRTDREFNDFKQRVYNEYQRRYTYGNRSRITLTNDISTSAQLLGINIVQDDEETIKKKYRKLAMKWHPDRFANDTTENQEIAKRNFQKVNGAYQKIKEYKNIN